MLCCLLLPSLPRWRGKEEALEKEGGDIKDNTGKRNREQSHPNKFCLEIRILYHSSVILKQVWGKVKAKPEESHQFKWAGLRIQFENSCLKNDWGETSTLAHFIQVYIMLKTFTENVTSQLQQLFHQPLPRLRTNWSQRHTSRLRKEQSILLATHRLHFGRLLWDRQLKAEELSVSSHSTPTSLCEN